MGSLLTISINWTRAQGSAHYEVPEEKGRALIQQLQTLLPGLRGTPKYVREIAGEPSKTQLTNL